jgi:membrane protease YdiL (CAAX protease family)
MKIQSPAGHLRHLSVAALASFGVAAFGTLTWGPLLIANSLVLPSVPWAVPMEGFLLWAIWRYLGGAGWPRRTSTGRRELLRAYRVPTAQFVWAGIAGVFSLVALAGLWIVLVRVTGVGGNPTLSITAGVPAWVAVGAIGIASLVSPLSEEAGFRGYGQVLLERHYSGIVAVSASSLFFALYHGPTQGFAPSKLAFYFVVGLVFGTTAWITKSTLPALPVHIAGDLLFFVVIWPHDAGRTVVWTHGADGTFWLNVAQVIVFGTLAVLAFARLRSEAARTRRHAQGHKPEAAGADVRATT